MNQTFKKLMARIPDHLLATDIKDETVFKLQIKPERSKLRTQSGSCERSRSFELRFRRPVSQRLIGLVLLVLLVSTQPGCQIFRKHSRSSATPLPVQFNQLPSQQQLIASLNARSARVRQLSSRVTVNLPGAPKIRGNLQVEFPNRMRMTAGIMGASELGVDVGSNDQDFWIWSKASLPGQPPALYHANHSAFQTSAVRQSIPLEPKWVIEAIGLVNFSPTDVHYGPVMTPDGRMKLTTVHQTASGPQYRVTLLTASTGLIEQQAMYDSAGKRIAYVNSLKYRNYPDDQMSLPQKIELFMTQPDGTDLKIELEAGTYSFRINGDTNQLWRMPNPPQVQKIDLTQVSNLGQPQRPTGNSRYQQPSQSGSFR